jgi:hypothetical protein
LRFGYASGHSRFVPAGAPAHPPNPETTHGKGNSRTTVAYLAVGAGSVGLLQGEGFELCDELPEPAGVVEQRA